MTRVAKLLADAGVASLGPCVIGATGGSGTRVVARIARRAGLFMGGRLNEPEDTLVFATYYDRWINTVMRFNSPLPCDLTERMSEELATVLESDAVIPHQSNQRWGWKEPRSIYLIRFFDSQFPAFKFLHVIRDGRDMAFSGNQNQLKKHGSALLSVRERFARTPLKSITLWSRINQMAADYGEAILGSRYLRIRFEDLCANPVSTSGQIVSFLELKGDPEAIARQEVVAPPTIGRWQLQSPTLVAKVQQAGEVALRRFGYLE